jgi:hypothetical protein
MGKISSTIAKLCLFISGFLLLMSLEGKANTFPVPSQYPTIQQAINAAQNGDTVLVAPGTYVENIDFLGKAIRVTSAAGAQLTIIDGSHLKPVVAFISGESRTSILNGFTIRNGIPSIDFVNRGGGIAILSSSPSVTNNIISGNKSCSGGAGIAILGGAPLIQSNLITDNQQSNCLGGYGGGILVESPSENLEILNNSILNNSFSAGGGIGLTGVSHLVTVKGNLIQNNEAHFGGGIYLDVFSSTPIVVVQNLIVENRSFLGGGIHWNSFAGSLIQNTIANNEVSNSDQVGSGIYSHVSKEQSNWANNIIIAQTGKNALYCQFGSAPTIKNCNVYSSSGLAYGGICANQTGINGNISADPLFVNPAAGDYHLRPGSPAIDAGDNTAPHLPATDFDGNLRIFDGDHNGSSIIDMGVYEFGSTAFDICIQDDSSKDSLRINTLTGAYQLVRCRDGFTVGGMGTITRRG